MAGGSGLNVAITGTWLVISLILDFVLIPGHGIEGAAAAYAVAIVGENVTTTVAVARMVGITPAGKGVLVAGSAALACYGGVGLAARWLLGPTLVSFVLYLAVASTLYLAILWRSRHALDVGVLARVVRRRASGDVARVSAEG
jgi:hypothetical protein